MAVSDGYAEHVQELLAGLGPVRIKRMFGGAGVYRDDLMFGLVANETLWFKADEATKPEWEAAGSEPFTFEYKNGRRETMSYWRLPASAADDAAEAQRWARLGYEAASRAKRPRAKGTTAELGPGPWDDA